MSNTKLLNLRRELLTQSEAAERLGLTNPGTLAVWRSTQRYDLPYIRVGRSIRYDAKAIEEFLSRNTEKGGGE